MFESLRRLLARTWTRTHWPLFLLIVCMLLLTHWARHKRIDPLVAAAVVVTSFLLLALGHAARMQEEGEG